MPGPTGTMATVSGEIWRNVTDRHVLILHTVDLNNFFLNRCLLILTALLRLLFHPQSTF